MDHLRALEVEAMAYSTLHVVDIRGVRRSILWSVIARLPLFGRGRKSKAPAVVGADALSKAKSSANA
jgi:hypothetical protein